MIMYFLLLFQFESTIKSCGASELEETRVNHILEAIPQKLQRKFKELCNVLLDEVKMEYRESGKQCAVSYIIKRPANRKSWDSGLMNKSVSGLRAVTPVEWHENYDQTRLRLEKILCIGHPLLCQTLDLWTQYSSTRIIEIPKIRAQKESFRIFSFRSSVMVYGEKCRTKLWNDWFESILKNCSDVFLKKRKGIRLSIQQYALKSLQTLITVQILSIINSSIEDYISLFNLTPMSYNPSIKDMPADKKPPRFSIFLNFVKKTKSIELDPPLADIEEAITECVNLLVNMLQFIPNFEKIIQTAFDAKFPVSPGYEYDKKEKAVPVILLGDCEQAKVSVETSKITSAIGFLKEYTASCFEKAEEYLKRYDKYRHLFSSELNKEITAYLSEEHTFEEYAEVN